MFPIMFVIAFNAVAQQQPEVGDIKCSLCHVVANKIDDFLKQNKTETEILSEIEKVCKLTAKWEKDCDTIVETYGKTIIENVADLGADKVCTLIGLCIDIDYDYRIQTSKCSMCEFVKELVEELLKSKIAEKDFEKFLDTGCDFIGQHNPSLGEMCKEFVSAYASEIIVLIENKIDNVCQYMNICVDISKFIGNSFGDIDKCTICKLTVGEIYHLLDDQTVKSDILKELNKMCSLFPVASEQSECDDFLDMFAEMLINFLEHDEDPTTLCDQLHVCVV